LGGKNSKEKVGFPSARDRASFSEICMVATRRRRRKNKKGKKKEERRVQRVLAMSVCGEMSVDASTPRAL
jgi:hypothetical protein